MDCGLWTGVEAGETWVDTAPVGGNNWNWNRWGLFEPVEARCRTLGPRERDLTVSLGTEICGDARVSQARSKTRKKARKT